MNKLEKMITPVCEGNYIWIFKPNEKFTPVYSVTCVVDKSDEWKKLKEHIERELNVYYDSQCKITKRKLKKCPHLPWRKDENGNELFVVKNNAEGTKRDGTKFTVKPIVYGPDLNVLRADQLKGDLGNGTKLRAGFTLNLWWNEAQGVGVSARLKFVQIIEPKYYSALDAFATFGEELKPHDINPEMFNLDPFTSKLEDNEDQALMEPEFIQSVQSMK